MAFREIKLNTTKQAHPMIYAYSTPQIAAHNGWTKIGYTEMQDVLDRIKQQTRTSDTEFKLEWKGNAVFEDGTYERFTDKDFHAYLRKNGIGNKKGTEWFHIDGPNGRSMFYDFKENHGVISSLGVVPYTLRAEQAQAVHNTADFYENHRGKEFLWNAKPRFGKTLSVYDFCKTVKAQNVLIVTNRPAIANSWYSDYMQFMGDESGFKFVSETASLKGKFGVMSRQEYTEYVRNADGDPCGCIEFLSLQDLKGSVYFGGKFDKLKEIADLNWDILVIDEAHEGVDTYKTDVAFDRISRKFTLHLSGTPFKALANDKFSESAIFNWTYADEQKAKRDWDEEKDGNNPYANLPFLNLFTYQMSEIIKDELDRGVEIQGETEEYAFDLNEFFETKQTGAFVHDSSVTRFLDALATQPKFPFSTDALRKELKHTFWLLNRVDSAKALARKLAEHPVFKDYTVVLAAGDGKLDDTEETQKSFDKVKEAIAQHDKTITLSVGQLTTGITIPEWTGVLMLSNIKSPALYMQAAFRAQNPCMFCENGQYFRKENAYVFDFDPARTLTIFEMFANDLSSETTSGRGDAGTRAAHVRELLNFFPVIGEDENGEMIELDAEKVLSIPRKIRSQEVVRRGFMSNFLFQNISGIFGAPQEVIDILSKLTPLNEPKPKDIPITPETAEGLNINPETGEVEIPEEQIIGTASDVFGEKIYGPAEEEIQDQIQDAFDAAEAPEEDLSPFDKLKEQFKEKTVKGIVDVAKEKYGDDLRPSDAKRIEKELGKKAERTIDRVHSDFEIEVATAERERLAALQSRFESGQTEADINAAFEKKKKELEDDMKAQLNSAMQDFIAESAQSVVETVETKIKEREKDDIEDAVRAHLRGFSRTIPSFLMAYGDDSVTLATFDSVIPNPVFLEVTSITLDQFRFLRDGGEYNDSATGEKSFFAGNLFDQVVFDDSVKEFLRLKKKLADYFDEKSIEDIFDYIPPQKTNQIFTPKTVVEKMVDMLEKENPGCFDDPDKTFIDLYMKSGLYITEIVKRLYRSDAIKAKFPDPKERLRHIFEKQVYGLAPTEIIYRIALAYILGFDETVGIEKHNFKQLDATPYAKDGTLKDKLAELFG